MSGDPADLRYYPRMNSISRIAATFIALLFAGAAQAQTMQLTCKVTWEPDCIDALLNKQKCPLLFGTEAATGTLKIDGGKARAENLGVVLDYSVTRKTGSGFVLEGEWLNTAYFVRGHGTFDSATRQLKLYQTLGNHRGDNNIVQRGLVADCS